MGCSSCWRAVYFLYIGVPFLLIATVMSVVGMIAPYWRTGDDYLEGLYHKCANGSCSQLTDLTYGGGDEDAWRVCQVFCVVSVFCMLVSSGLTIVYLLKKRNNDTMGWKIPNTILITAIIAGLSVILINILYRVFVNKDESQLDNQFSFHFTHATPPLIIIAGCYIRQYHISYDNRAGSGGPGYVA